MAGYILILAISGLNVYLKYIKRFLATTEIIIAKPFNAQTSSYLERFVGFCEFYFRGLVTIYIVPKSAESPQQSYPWVYNIFE